MNGFRNRLSLAQEWEDDLKKRLIARGYSVASFGQAMFPEVMRSALLNFRDADGYPTPLRWAADLLVVDPADSATLCLVDAKTGRKNTPNYCIEVNAVDANIHMDSFRLPVYFVCENEPGKSTGVLTPQDVLTHQHSLRSGESTSNGSTTDFYLIKKTFARKAGDVFPD